MLVGFFSCLQIRWIGEKRGKCCSGMYIYGEFWLMFGVGIGCGAFFSEILKQVYADHSTRVDEVFSRIIETTRHPAAAASFASIIFAPQGQLSFDETLTRCKTNKTSVCLMYGKEDPWVRPVWGFQVKCKVPEAPYYEISPAGHCPHDEVPEVVNFLLRGWIRNLESSGSIALPLLDGPESVDFVVTKDMEFSRKGSRKSVRVQYRGSKFSVWNRLTSHFKPLFKERTV
ncbi:Pheophytinase- chloroplastic [Striga hermonthica]|uniref:Pheophytinase- chloroplastic n=1 Tax=Striga hermonthica TaxID=68872 RepID=A0A9N7RFD3_STRHE|nr:Pheophytinase- chloroplastic [Striga hermonthica]